MKRIYFAAAVLFGFIIAIYVRGNNPTGLIIFSGIFISCINSFIESKGGYRKCILRRS